MDGDAATHFPPALHLMPGPPHTGPWFRPRAVVKPLLGGLALIIAATLIGLGMSGRFQQANVAMIYLLAVVISALRWGQWPSLMTAACVPWSKMPDA